MSTLVKIVAILIFVVVAGFIIINVTKTIFNKVAGNITEKITGNITSGISGSITGDSSAKIEKKDCNLPKTKREFKAESYYSGPLIDSHVHLPTSS